MRRRFVMRHGQLVELDLDASRPPRSSPLAAPMVIGDIAPYRSMRTGEMIAGRAQHRDHLRQYGLVEIGNEIGAFTAPQPPVGPIPGEIAEAVKRQLARDPGERRAEAETVLRQAGCDGPQLERIIGDAPP